MNSSSGPQEMDFFAPKPEALLVGVPGRTALVALLRLACKAARSVGGSAGWCIASPRATKLTALIPLAARCDARSVAATSSAFAAAARFSEAAFCTL